MLMTVWNIELACFVIDCHVVVALEFNVINWELNSNMEVVVVVVFVFTVVLDSEDEAVEVTAFLITVLGAVLCLEVEVITVVGIEFALTQVSMYGSYCFLLPHLHI